MVTLGRPHALRVSGHYHARSDGGAERASGRSPFSVLRSPISLMIRTALINVVGLTRSLIGTWSPHLAALAERMPVREIVPPLPAVTCTVQASMLTGRSPDGHGIVANGWYDRESAEIRFWKQSNRLVAGEKVWETARQRDPSVTCAQLFWWFNMYSSADWSVTPRPIYKADGRKLPDCYSHPASLRDELQAELGTFPLFRFWGPASGIESSRWIADAALHVDRAHAPTLSFVYLPHLDYGLQQLGPDDPAIREHVTAIDGVVGDLVAHYDEQGVRVVVLSEYGIEPVNRPVHLNRVLREEGLLAVRVEEGQEQLDAGASRAFAVAASPGGAHLCSGSLRYRSRCGDPRCHAGRRAGPRQTWAGRDRHRAPSCRRSRRRRGAWRLVHLLLLARRCPRPGLRAHRRHPPKAWLRPGGALHRSGDSQAEGRDRVATASGRSSASER